MPKGRKEKYRTIKDPKGTTVIRKGSKKDDEYKKNKKYSEKAHESSRSQAGMERTQEFKKRKKSMSRKIGADLTVRRTKRTANISENGRLFGGKR